MSRRLDIETVLDQIEGGDRDAFQQIVRAFSLPLRSYIAARVYHRDELDDLTQEVFIAAYGSLAAFRRGDVFRGLAEGDRAKQGAASLAEFDPPQQGP